MKPWSLIIVLVMVGVLLGGCKKAPHNQITDIQKVEIHLYKKQKDRFNKRYKTVTFTSASDIKAIAGALSSTKTPLYKCGYNGEVKLYSKTKGVLSYEYNTGTKCSHGSYVYKGKLHSYKLSKSGLDLLKKLAQSSAKKAPPKSSKAKR